MARDRRPDAPLLAFEAQGFTLYGVTMETTEQLTRELSERRKWAQKLGSRPSPDTLVAIAPETPLVLVAPMLAALRSSGSSVLALTRLPARHWASRTLGDLTYEQRYCGVPIPSTIDYPAETTWGQLLASLPPCTGPTR